MIARQSPLLIQLKTLNSLANLTSIMIDLDMSPTFSARKLLFNDTLMLRSHLPCGWNLGQPTNLLETPKAISNSACGDFAIIPKQNRFHSQKPQALKSYFGRFLSA